MIPGDLELDGEGHPVEEVGVEIQHTSLLAQ